MPRKTFWLKDHPMTNEEAEQRLQAKSGRAGFFFQGDEVVAILSSGGNYLTIDEDFIPEGIEKWAESDQDKWPQDILIREK